MVFILSVAVALTNRMAACLMTYCGGVPCRQRPGTILTDILTADQECYTPIECPQIPDCESIRYVTTSTVQIDTHLIRAV
jgi:hypothetical protein